MTQRTEFRVIRALRDFYKGFTGQHVDYYTRHYSRAYDRGQGTSMIAVVAVSIGFVFAAGFGVGRLC